MADLTNKVAIVTGSGSGLGTAIALRLCEAGAKVMMAGRNVDGLKEGVERIREEGFEASFFSCDPTKKLDLNTLLAATIDAYDHVDILVNNFRDYQAKDFLELGEDDLAEAIAINMMSAFNLSQLTARLMIKQFEEGSKDREKTDMAGTIVNVSSIAGRLTAPKSLTFSVACAGLDQLTRSMSVALATHKIRVNGIAPGGIMTQSLAESLSNIDGLRQNIVTQTPLGRIAECEEAAEAVLFLASDASSFMTGQVVDVDGGRGVVDPIALMV